MSNERDDSAAGDSISLIPANILECHQRFESDVETPYFVSLPLEPRLFQIIRPQLDHLFRRYDYDGDAGIIILRMPSKIHDDFAFEFGLMLQQRVDGILRKMPDAPRILNRQARQVKLWEHDRSKRGRECYPDGQFMDDRAYHPGLVFEVGYSQTGDCLEKIAKEYILGTEGDVTTVVCFDLKYNQGASFVSIWRASWNFASKTVEPLCDLEPTMFQDSDGEMVNGDKLLKLGLTDMAEEKYSDDYSLTRIHIPFSQLSDIFDFAKVSSAKRKSP